MFGRRRDAKAHEEWSRLTPYTRAPAPVGRRSQTMLGRVEQVYQKARRGTKVIVWFDGAGQWDTWWEGRHPKAGSWVLIDCHLWTPPGTHSGAPVLWVDAWRGTWSNRLKQRADRHRQRLASAVAR